LGTRLLYDALEPCSQILGARGRQGRRKPVDMLKGTSPLCPWRRGRAVLVLLVGGLRRLWLSRSQVLGIANKELDRDIDYKQQNFTESERE
jgi:hypothetical protein